MDTQGIYDLKAVQQNAQNVTVFKNHLRQYVKIRPKNQRPFWAYGNTIEIPLLGQGLDYINFAGSSLVVEMELVNLNDAQPYPDNVEMLFGMCGLIRRYQLRAGAADIEDIDHYGRFMWLQMMGHAAITINETESLVNPFSNDTWNRTANQNHRTFKVPLITMFEKAGYVPIYNIAEDLVLRLGLANPNDWLRGSGNTGGVPNTASYRIRDAYFLADGMSATSGGQLSDQPFRFHTHTSFGRVETVPEGDSILERYVYDLKKTSMKKWIGMFAREKQVDQQNTIEDGMESRANTDDFQYGFFLGGQPFPFKETIKTPLDAFYQYKKYFNRQDAIGNADAGVVHYRNNFLIDATELHDFQRFYPCAVFDKLDQTGKVISGIDTERYDIELQIEANTDQLEVARLFSYFTWDVIVTIIGGEIKLED